MVYCVVQTDQEVWVKFISTLPGMLAYEPGKNDQSYAKKGK